MRMDILQGKGIRRTFLGVEAHRYPLDDADIVHGALLVKVGEGDMAVLLIDLDRRDGRGDFLDQGQILFQIIFICPVDQLL